MAESAGPRQPQPIIYDDGLQAILTQNNSQRSYLDGAAPEVVPYDQAILTQNNSQRSYLDRAAPEVVPYEYSDEPATLHQAYGQAEKELVYDPPQSPIKGIVDQPDRSSKRKRRMIVTAIGVILAAIAIAVGVAVTQTHKQRKQQSTPSPPPSAPNNATNQTTDNPHPNFLSTVGAFNGSGLAAADPLTITGDLLLFFQHHTGDLRFSELSDNTWSGGNSDDSLGVKTASNATPIAATSYQEVGTSGGVVNWIVFYLDDSLTLQNVIRDNITNTWTNGNLGSFNFRGVSGGALAVCFSADWYGPDVGKSGGLRLFAGGEDGLVHEYTWSLGNTSWETGFTYPNTNGYAGIACWPGGGITNVYLQNSDSSLEVWWKDFNTLATNTSTHPLGVWTQGPSAATAVRQNSSLAFSNNAYFQTDSGNILAIGLGPGGAETFTWGLSFSVDNVQAMPGTAITCQTFFPSTTGPSGLYVFFQDNGTDVTEYVRSQDGGPWSMDYIPVN